MRHHRQTSFLLIFLGFLAASLRHGLAAPTAGPTGVEQQDRYFRAVYGYVSNTCPDLAQTQREEVVRGGLVREIKEWPFQERLLHHRLFAFPRGSSFNRGAELVAVGENL